MYFAISYVGYKFRILTANFAPTVQEVSKLFLDEFLVTYNLRNQKEEKLKKNDGRPLRFGVFEIIILLYCLWFMGFL